MKQHSGFVSIIGRPNVGKSTLMNRLIGQKISITSSKPQTTRHAITGIYTDHYCQAIFIDTPGLHKAEHSALNRQLNKTATSSLEMADVILYMVEALKFTADDELALKRLKHIDKPVILIVNKVDHVKDKEQLFPFLSEMMAKYTFTECIPISALDDKQMKLVIKALTHYLPEQSFLFDEDEITTASSAFLASEVLREKLTRRLNQELPYALTVEIESFEDTAEVIRINAIVWVERDTQKGIVIGKNGTTLKEASTQARQDLEKLYGKKVFLKAFVKVRQGWSDDERSLNALGYMSTDL